ncbi:hypothetical protein [Rugamonas sp.]|uniref:hypothetical protein n=1 Tax=Rugamonas sp. TaxID=1926287 RepID=UPI0025FBC909|nr:hypothetical protein [Rugamonas sp.]
MLMGNPRFMKYITFATTLIVSACAFAAPSRVLPPVARIEKASTYFLAPTVGEASTAEVGESLYTEGIRTVTRKFRATLKAGATSTMDRGYVLKVNPGTQVAMKMRPENNLPVACFTTNNTGIIGFFGDRNVVGCLIDEDKKNIFTAAMFEGYAPRFPLSNPVPYDVEVTETAIEEKDDFYVDMLYQGLSKGEVKISYREFSGGYARPAFTQDVAYELAADGTTTLAFKGLRIKVLKATGSTISYVLETPLPTMMKYRVPASSGSDTGAPKPWYQK